MKWIYSPMLAVVALGTATAGPLAIESPAAAGELSAYTACMVANGGQTRAAAARAEEVCQWQLVRAAERLRLHGYTDVREAVALIKMAGSFAHQRSYPAAPR